MSPLTVTRADGLRKTIPPASAIFGRDSASSPPQVASLLDARPKVTKWLGAVALVFSLIVYGLAGSNVASAGDVTNLATLRTQVGSGGSNPVTFNTIPGITIINSDDSVVLGRLNVLLQGNPSSGLQTQIQSMATSITSSATATPNANSSTILGWINSQLSSFSVPTLTYIQGQGTVTPRVSTSPTETDMDKRKVINFNAANSNLSFSSINFKDFVVNYLYNTSSAGGVVNPFIGNNTLNIAPVSYNSINNNYFSDITVVVTATLDTH